MRELIHEGCIELAGQRLPYRFHRRAGRRHMRMQIDDEGTLEVRGPWRSRPEEAECMALEHAQWVLGALERWREKRRARPVLCTGAMLPFAGEELVLAVTEEAQLDLLADVPCPNLSPAPDCAGPALLEASTRAGQRSRRSARAGRWLKSPYGRVRRVGGVLEVRPLVLAPGAVRDLVVAWYRREAKRYLPERVRSIGACNGLTPTGVAIRAQRTLWGSCTARGLINLNWKLVLLPVELADYVMVHELCHLEHLNHSRRFWARVGSIEPEYRSMESRLDLAQDLLPL